MSSGLRTGLQGPAVRSGEADVQLLEEGHVKSDTIRTAGRGKVDYGYKGGGERKW